MTISFNIPPSLESAITRAGGDPAAAIKEAALVELYRQGIISHGEFADALGVARTQVDEILARHNVVEDLVTPDEFGEQAERLRKLLG